MDPAPVLTEADVCRKITAATQLLTERRKLHDLATQAITKQQILMDAGLVTAKTIKASAATIKKAAEAVSDAENQVVRFLVRNMMMQRFSFIQPFSSCVSKAVTFGSEKSNSCLMNVDNGKASNFTLLYTTHTAGVDYNFKPATVHLGVQVELNFTA
ncbi:hypothetical protein CDAR_109901 [Caerostris darwini]|uniref:Uncharacterized protein n=1 Tax=Caerostris darwini TaxID=1538125 RepID=A0AAV4SXK6_9ARAC|nr:hypothetical protein CDAR_109901 [Caerostris darwini]